LLNPLRSSSIGSDAIAVNVWHKKGEDEVVAAGVRAEGSIDRSGVKSVKAVYVRGGSEIA
jgi:hypothetical protein